MSKTDEALAEIRDQLEELRRLATGLYGSLWAVMRRPELVHDETFTASARQRLTDVREAGWDSITDWFPE